MLYFRLLDLIVVENKGHDVQEGLLGVLYDVLISHDVDWDFGGFHPVLVEVSPDPDLLMDPLVPEPGELLVIFVVYRPVVGTCANHVEQGYHAV